MLGIPSKLSMYLFRTIILLLPLVFLTPLFGRLRRRSRKKGRPHLSLYHRGICVLLAYIMLITPSGFQTLAEADIQYGDIQASDWGSHGESIEYKYDANGSMKEKKIVNGATTTTYAYEYNLQNRVAKLTKSETGQSDVVTLYKYDTSGRLVEKDVYGVTTSYLVDHYNHTGYSQVLKETTGTDVKSYIIGSDVLAQTLNTNGTQYLLYDGHGSTRQVTDSSTPPSIIDSYSYDAYGVMLGGNPTSVPATNLLYAGEQFDINSQMYYNRARWYDTNNGRFNRVDPFSGNYSDPQSLHKYLYCHANPTNGIDPSGKDFSLASVISTMSNIGAAFVKYYPILRVGLVIADILTVTNIVLKAITQGLSSVTVGEWAELALITTTVFFGGKIARRIAKRLISRALRIPMGILRSFDGLSDFIRSKGIILEIDDMIVYTKKGARVIGEFDLIDGKTYTQPMIVLHKGGHTASTLIHEYIHYFQWKYFVGGSRYDWINFINISNYEKYLDDVAYFIGEIFSK